MCTWPASQHLHLCMSGHIKVISRYYLNHGTFYDACTCKLVTKETEICQLGYRWCGYTLPIDCMVYIYRACGMSNCQAVQLLILQKQNKVYKSFLCCYSLNQTGLSCMFSVLPAILYVLCTARMCDTMVVIGVYIYRGCGMKNGKMVNLLLKYLI